MWSKEAFDKTRARTIGWVDLPRGGFREVIPRIRVELYDPFSKTYGPIMLSFNAIRPENMKTSKPLAQAHLTEVEAIKLCALLVKAVNALRPAAALDDILRQIRLEAMKL